MLIGEYQHSLDTKGRVNFPAKLREDLGRVFIIAKGMDNCLAVYSETEWRALEDRMRALPVSQSKMLQRFFFSGACEVEPDKQGRILIPSNLREYAMLDRDVMIIGASVRAEIWDKRHWDEKCGGITSEMVAKAMEDLGF